jgi:hypothetical protein
MPTRSRSSVLPRVHPHACHAFPQCLEPQPEFTTVTSLLALDISLLTNTHSQQEQNSSFPFIAFHLSTVNINLVLTSCFSEYEPISTY